MDRRKFLTAAGTLIAGASLIPMLAAFASSDTGNTSGRQIVPLN